MTRFFTEVYGQDNPEGEAHGWIQWKGTDACIDLHCKCGFRGHFDGDFFYHFECPSCHAKYAVGQNVKLILLNEEQIREVEKDYSWKDNKGFDTCELDDD